MQQGSGVAACYNCGRPWGDGGACQYCSQTYGFPAGIVTSSSGKRFVAYLLEIALVMVTCAIGWLIWALIVFGRGQTPAKQIMGMRVANMTTLTRSGWGRTFVREVIAKGLIGIFLGWLIVPYFWLLWDKNRQQLWDKMVDTVVVDDPNGLVTDVPPGGGQYGQQSQYLQQPGQQYQLPASQQPGAWDQQQGGYGQQGGGYGQYGGYGQQGGYGQPQYPPQIPPPPPNVPPPPRR